MPAEYEAILSTIWPILLMIVIFYFLLYRPQKKQEQARKAMLESLKKGSKIVTIGGIYGTIVEVSADHIMVEVAEKVVLKMTRTSVGSILNGKK